MTDAAPDIVITSYSIHYTKLYDLALLDVNRPFALATLAICLFGEGSASEAEAAMFTGSCWLSMRGLSSPCT